MSDVSIVSDQVVFMQGFAEFCSEHMAFYGMQKLMQDALLLADAPIERRDEGEQLPECGDGRLYH